MSRRQRTLTAAVPGALLAAGLVVVPAGGAPAADTPAPLVGAAAGREVVAGRYLVVLEAGVSGSGGTAAVSRSVRRARDLGGTVHRQFTRALHGYAATLDAAELAAVRADPAVAYVEPVRRYRAQVTQPDVTWGLDRIDQRGLPLNSSYRYSVTGAGVTAYVLDSGIRRSHEDFDGRAVAGTDTSGDPRTCDPVNDGSAHGTHVAGTVGGTYYGVAKGVRLVDVRVLDCDGAGTSEGILAGIEWTIGNHAVGQPAVANLSFGTSGTVTGTTAIDRAVQRLIDDGVTVVISAGNEAKDACATSPAHLPAAITVGASTPQDTRDTEYSNYGTCLDLFAPGTDIESAFSWSDTSSLVASGTSMAAPHVAGAAALYLQTNPTATPAQVAAALVRATTTNALRFVNGSPNRLLFALQPATPPPGPTQPDRLVAGTALRRGEKVCSPNGLYCLVQQTDGNTVLYKPGNRPVWASGKKYVAWVLMQSDGNLVGYDSYGQPVWASRTGGNGASTLRVQDDGNLVVYRDADRRATWSSGSRQRTAPPQVTGRTDRIPAGRAIYRGGARLTSPNGTYTLALQTDGNLVLRRNGTAIWSGGKRDDDWLTVQTDGNQVRYRADGAALWSSRTGGNGAAVLRLQDDGNLVLYRTRDNQAIWTR